MGNILKEYINLLNIDAIIINYSNIIIKFLKRVINNQYEHLFNVIEYGIYYILHFYNNISIIMLTTILLINYFYILFFKIKQYLKTQKILLFINKNKKKLYILCVIIFIVIYIYII